MSNPSVFDLDGYDPPTIRWGKHTKNMDISRIFNDLFSFELSDHIWRSLFINIPDSPQQIDIKKAIVPDDVIERIRASIGIDILLPVATDTPGNDDGKLLCYKHILDTCPLYVGYQQSDRAVRTRLTNRSSFQNILTRLCNKQIREGMFIEVAIQGIFFPDDLSLCNFLEWTAGNMKTDGPFPPTPGFAPAVASAPGAAPAPGTQPLTAQAITAAVSAALSSTPSATAHGNSVLTNYTGPSSGYAFNTTSLPSDVLLRYNAWKSNKALPGSTIAKKYTSNDWYHDGNATTNNVPTERIILADGTLFIVRNVSYPTLFKLPATRCTDTSHAGIRLWYYALTKSLMDQGIYVHPFWCFRKAVGNYWGFTTSTAPAYAQEVDLPHSMATPLQPMTSAVHSHIMKTGTFDSKSEYAKIIRSCPSDGYRALKLIIMRSHPNFIEEPAQYLTDYPQQKKDESVFDFTQVFSDYLQLQSFVMDNNRGIGDKSIQDIFLSCCYYKFWIKKHTYDERKSKPSLYTAELFFDTIMQHFTASDSPYQREKRESAAPARPSTYTGRYQPASKPKSAPIRAILPAYGTYPPSDYAPLNALSAREDIPKEDNVESPYDSGLREFSEMSDALKDIDVPNSPEDQDLYRIYVNAVRSLPSQPDAAFSGTCIVCGGSHNFDNCDVLNDKQFLRGHYIRFCQMVRKNASALRNDPSMGSPSARVNALHTSRADDYDADTDDPDVQPREQNFR